MAGQNSRQYRFVGMHADSLASGRPVAPGEFIELSPEEARDPHNKSMIDERTLVVAADGDVKKGVD